MHDATRVMLGSTGSSDRTVTQEPSDPASFPAGLAVRKATSGGLQLAADAVAALIGVSLGASLSDTKKTAVCRTGNFVPLLLTNDPADVKLGNITYTAKVFGVLGNDITITIQDGDVEAGATIETDPESPNDVIIQIEDGVTLTQAVVDAIEADEATSALIAAVIDEGDEDEAVDAVTETPLTGGTDVASPGAVVKVSDSTGMGTVGATSTGAVYLSGPLIGVYEDGTEAYCAHISLQAGF